MELAALFDRALEAIDAGDIDALGSLVEAHPELVRSRLEEASPRLRERIGGALDTYFARPYLLWFLSEDAPRAGRLPQNILALAECLIEAIRRHAPETYAEQVDEAVKWVAWSGVAAASGHQCDLLRLLIDLGAKPCSPEVPLINRHLAAAQTLIEKGAPTTLAASLLLRQGVPEIAKATHDELQGALILSALNGDAQAIRILLAAGADPHENQTGMHEHGLALHHAAWSGSVEAVQALVESGADLSKRDGTFGATPRGWAEYGGREAVLTYLASIDAPV